jgi:hypothetical protein
VDPGIISGQGKITIIRIEFYYGSVIIFRILHFLRVIHVSELTALKIFRPNGTVLFDHDLRF